jgi:ArsR family transcriptional regulator
MLQPCGDRVFEVASELFGLLAAPTRLRIVCALMEGEHNVSQLLERIEVSQPNISQHLGMLYRAGVLSRRRRGVQVFYKVTHEGVKRLCRALRSPVAPDAPQRAVARRDNQPKTHRRRSEFQ